MGLAKFFFSEQTPDIAVFRMAKAKIKSPFAQYSKRLARNFEDSILL